MVYEQFQKAVKESLEERLGSGYCLSLQTVTKNNGLTLDGICIGKAQEHTAPAIYLQTFYDTYQKGKPLPQILDEIIELYRTHHLPEDSFIEELHSEIPLTDRIIFRLINESANRSLLLDLPHLSYPDLDLSLIFCLSLNKSDDQLLTALIHNSHQKLWNLSTEDLYLAAKTNTPRLFPARISSLMDVIKEITMKASDTEIKEEDWAGLFEPSPLSPPMYVLTNTFGAHGAACMFYEGILKDFAERTDGDLIILPSSIHEVLMIPYSSQISYEELAQTVFSINQEEVAKEDRLSNHIYHYSKSQNHLSIAFTSSFPIGTMNP
ncbi:hypothetical protein LAD12857_10060 [Lacrimispora amygdalina]|uniref:Uncharacterized protein n=1 Tax=Lacrimispora amygdalina TaxID=253257 RepID=A0A3E2NER7_9FIRM|nr:DUF5688 family protein [Clostridium indicum]RFZ79518.1 hypothetical protein DS742_08200 [Clostridium indicum]